MRRVQFDLVLNGTVVVYPDDRALFSNTEVINNVVYADYTGTDESIQDTQPDYIELTIEVDRNVAAVGESINYTGLFSVSFTGLVPLSIIDRNGKHIKNVGVNVVDGQTTGGFSFDQSGDFYIDQDAINYHRNVFTQELVLTTGNILMRVYE